jgi:hypothetical protein
MLDGRRSPFMLKSKLPEDHLRPSVVKIMRIVNPKDNALTKKLSPRKGNLVTSIPHINVSNSIP